MDTLPSLAAICSAVPAATVRLADEGALPPAIRIHSPGQQALHLRGVASSRSRHQPRHYGCYGAPQVFARRPNRGE